MEEKLVETVALDNGLTLEICDRSRRVAGDRWLVFFVARINVPVQPGFFDEASAGISLHVVRNSVGGHACYVREKKSNFVDENERDKEFEKLKNDFLETNLAYLSNPGFPGKMILRAYNESLGAAVRWKPQ
jgi:hypothetical protein